MGITYGFMDIEDPGQVYRLVKKVSGADLSEITPDDEPPKIGRNHPEIFSENICQLLDLLIGSDEIIWTGRPDPRLLMLKYWAVFPVAAIFMVIAIVTSLSTHLLTVALIPAFISFVALILPYRSYRVAKQLYYVIAADKAIVIRQSDDAITSRMLEGDELQRVRIKEKLVGPDEICFPSYEGRRDNVEGGTRKSGDGSFEMNGFYAFSNVDQVYQLFKAANEK